MFVIGKMLLFCVWRNVNINLIRIGWGFVIINDVIILIIMVLNFRVFYYYCKI